MAIKLTGVGQTLTNTPNDSVYTAPGDVTSATVASGTVENTSLVGVKLYLRVRGRNVWIIKGRDIPVIGAPLVLPPITLLPGESLEAWSELANTLDINLTIGEQR